MKLEYLKQADYVLSACGRPTLPGGLSAVCIPKGFLMPLTCLASGANLNQFTFTKEITGDTPWALKAISLDQLSLRNSQTTLYTRIQIQLPNGRYLFGGNGIAASDLGWVGSWRWAQDPDFIFQPGDKINVSISTNVHPDVVGFGVATIINLLFEGCYLYFMQGGQRAPTPVDLTALARYQGNVNENIMAPAWMSNEGVDTPDGYVDEYFIYSTPEPQSSTDPVTAFVLSAGAVQTGPSLLAATVDPGYDFYVRRAMFDAQFFSSAAGEVMATIRSGAGYALNNTRIDVVRYLCGAEFAVPWRVKGGDSIYLDTSIADPGGTGSITFQAHFEGYRRRPV